MQGRLEGSGPLNRRVLQPAPTGRHKQRTAPTLPPPVEAPPAGQGMKTEGFFHRRLPTPRQRNPQPGEGVRGEEAVAGRGSHSPVENALLALGKLVEDRLRPRATSGLEGAQREVILKSPFL